jgi:hypothetical protein
MTIDEFLEEVQTLRGTFQRHGGDDYVRDESGRCPVCALCRAKTGLVYAGYEFPRAGQELDLSEADAACIAWATDAGLQSYRAAMTPETLTLRRRLLEAVGLPPEE